MPTLMTPTLAPRSPKPTFTRARGCATSLPRHDAMAGRTSTLVGVRPALLFLFGVADDRGVVKSKQDDLFTGDSADIMVNAPNLRARDVVG